MDSIRIDKWLWAARFFKSRSAAATACDGGKVDVNGQRVRPARLVRPGDLVEVTLPGDWGRRIARIRALAERRGSAAAAALLIEDLTPPRPPREARRRAPLYRAPGLGRPTKRDRRQLQRLTGL
jgi:ribosome-associated heat shock protein Hsp15